jgi:hypothetical protein
MKIQTLIKKLKDVEELNPHGEVYIFDEIGMPICFSGFSVDDNNEANLYQSEGDLFA